MRELDEIVHVLERAVATAAVEVGHERRPADRREDRRVTAEMQVAQGVAGVKVEFTRRRGQQGARHPARYVDSIALHVGPGLAPQAQRFRVAAELDADLLENRLGVRLDDLDGLSAQQFDHGELAPYVGQLAGGLSRPRRSPGFAAVPGVPPRKGSFGHDRSPGR